MRKFSAGLPAGTAAYVFGEATRRRAAEEKIVEGLRKAGYREAMVPSADYLAPYAPHLDLREERELYRFVDRHGDTIALRADFTIALARHLAPRLPPEDSPTRLFYRGEVVRGGTREGATAEFYQIGAELLGATGAGADLEIVERCLESLAAADSGRLFLVLSCAGAVEALLAPELTGAPASQLAQVIRRRRLAETARIARAISADFSGRVRRLVEGGLGPEDPLLTRLGPAGSALAEVACRLTRRAHCELAIDLAEPPSRSYHTGFFFAVFGEEGGEPLAGGGRYDDLYGAFGRPRPAVGFSLGLEALMRA